MRKILSADLLLAAFACIIFFAGCSNKYGYVVERGSSGPFSYDAFHYYQEKGPKKVWDRAQVTTDDPRLLLNILLTCTGKEIRENFTLLKGTDADTLAADVRKGAIERLVKLRASAEIETFVLKTYNGRWSSYEAGIAFGWIQVHKKSTLFRIARESSRPEGRLVAMKLLHLAYKEKRFPQELGDPQQCFLRLFNEGPDNVKSTTALILMEMGVSSPQLWQRLMVILEQQPHAVDEKQALTLLKSNPAEGIPPLTEFLRKNSNNTFSVAPGIEKAIRLLAAGNIHSELMAPAVSLLQGLMMNASHSTTREEAAIALARIAPNDAPVRTALKTFADQIVARIESDTDKNSSAVGASMMYTLIRKDPLFSDLFKDKLFKILTTHKRAAVREYMVNAVGASPSLMKQGKTLLQKVQKEDTSASVRSAAATAVSNNEKSSSRLK